MRLNCDVLIAGAGPAGARVARDSARAGLDVVLVEEHKEVGVPCHCSGLVSPRTMDAAGVGEGLVLNSIVGATIHLPGRRSLSLTGKKPHALVIDRVELDRRLVEQAKDAGARVITSSRLTSFSLGMATVPTRGKVEAFIDNEGGRTKIAASVLVGADGPFSRVATQMRGVRPRRLVRGLGGQAEYYANPLKDHVEVFLDDRSAPGWFAWTIPLEKGSSRFGTGSSNGIKPSQSFERMRRQFPETFGTVVPVSRTAGAIAVWEPGPIIGDRIVLVGDAARQVKPTSGGGILTALRSASIAAETIASAFRRNDLSSAGLAGYPRRWNASIGKEFRRQHDMRRVFERLGEGELRRLLDRLDEGRVKTIVERSGDIDFPSRLSWHLLTLYPRLVFKGAVLPRFPGAWLFPGRQA